jgi:hypothetical protein
MTLSPAHASRRSATAFAAVALIAVACTATKKTTFGNGLSGGSDEATTAGAGGNNGAGGMTSSQTGLDLSAANSGSGGGGACESAPDADSDKDGFSYNQGDCNDCDALVNPGAIEVLTDKMDPKAVPADENCDGKVDEAAAPCDSGLPIGDADPVKGAKAIGLCKTLKANEKGWGVLKAAYTRANGNVATPGATVGLLPQFGPNVKTREGATLLALSSGYARDESGPTPCGHNSCSVLGPGQAPPNFPQDVPSCSGSMNINDDVALDLQIKAPSNATGYSYDFFFYSFEYPEWVCTSFNDQYIALVDPPPMGSINGNISFDSKKNPVSVNIAFFTVCNACADGTALMSGTGFNKWNDAGGTNWLTTQAPIKGGDTFKIRFAIWDTGDTAYDSTVLIDNFKWIAKPGTSVTINTVPTPK